MKSFLDFLTESSLQINWALKKSQAQNKYLYNDKDLVIVYLNTDKVMKHGNHVAIKPDGENAKETRLERLEQHVKSGGYLDPPDIGDIFHNGVITFGNGRHRFYYAWLHGIKKMPFFVMKEDKEYMLKRYG